MFLMEQCYFLFVFLQAFHELPLVFFSRLSQQNEEDKWVQWISLDFCRITMPSEILDPHPIKVVFKTQIGFTYNTVLLKESPTDQLLQMALDPTSHLPFTAASKIHPIWSLFRWLYHRRLHPSETPHQSIQVVWHQLLCLGFHWVRDWRQGNRGEAVKPDPSWGWLNAKQGPRLTWEVGWWNWLGGGKLHRVVTTK